MAKDNLRMYAAILRIAKLHKPETLGDWQPTCSECRDDEGFLINYPCPTIKALEGETE